MRSPFFLFAVLLVFVGIGTEKLSSDQNPPFMKKYAFATVLLLSLGLFAFWPSSKSIVQPADYEPYLTGEHVEKNKEKSRAQISFWEKKLNAAPSNFVFEKKLAALLAADFRLSGNIENLHRSDSFLRSVNERLAGQVGVLQSLASNATTRHAFREAEAYLTEALEIGEKKFATSLMLADVRMERGNLYSASYLLKDVASTQHFDFLIREMKFQDQKGNLESAIETMEKAADLARSSGSSHLVNWSLSNLGDMYGHDGRIGKSYETYLAALAENPADLHSLRGLAWIAFSNDENVMEAKRILNHLKNIHPVPDYDLMLAEIADFEQDKVAAKMHLSAFVAQAEKPVYGNMYKAYLCELKSQSPVGVAIAEAEITERPHPVSYSLLAWAKLQNGRPKTALETIENHVIHRTGEPLALYHAGVIFAKNKKKGEAEKYLREALDASFELGPVLTAEIKNELAQL